MSEELVEYPSFGTLTWIIICILILVSRCGSVRIASILLACSSPFFLLLLLRVLSQDQFIVYLYAKGRILVYDRKFVVSPLPLESYRVHLVFITHNSYCALFYVHRYSPFPSVLYSSAFPIRFCSPSGVSNIPTKSSTRKKKQSPIPVSSPTRDSPCFAGSTAAINHVHENIPWTNIGWKIAYIPARMQLLVRHQPTGAQKQKWWLWYMLR